MVSFEHPAMDLEQEYYSAIGEFIFRYAQLEYQMHELVWFALDIGYKKGRILTIGTDSKVLRGMLATITATDKYLHIARHKQEINSICGLSKKLYSIRNYLVHGSWQSADASSKNAAIHEMKEHRLMPPRSKLRYGDIYQHVSALKQKNALAQRLIVELGGVRPPSLDKYARRIRLGQRS